MAAPAVTVVPAVRAGSAATRAVDAWLLMAVMVAPVALRGPRAMVRPVPRVWPARRNRATAWTVARAVRAVPAAMVALREPAVYPLLLRAGPRAKRARSAWLPMVVPLVPAVPAEPDSMPQV